MKLKRRSHRRVPKINTASIADISFTLLILFLVVTSMDDDKGHTRKLPPAIPDNQEIPEIIERNVMQIDVMADNKLVVDGESLPFDSLQLRVMQFVDNPHNLSTLPEKHLVHIDLLGECSITDNHVIKLSADRDADYGSYFKVQDAIMSAYRELRKKLALKRFGKSYEECSEMQREALRTYYPQRVSEVYSKEGGLP